MMGPPPIGAIQGRSFFTSWSGGKDSCLALHRAIQMGGKPAGLLTMMTEDRDRSRAHGLHISVLEAQARALQLPLWTRATSMKGYEATFIDALEALKTDGIADGVYGDIDLEPHREWVWKVSDAAGVRAHHPLWQGARRSLVTENLRLGVRARIIAVQDGKLPVSFLGRVLDEHVADEIESLGSDACGEHGEYHTVVEDAPLFRAPLRLELREASLRSGYWFLDVGTRREETEGLNEI